MTSASMRPDRVWRGPPWTTRWPIASMPSISRIAVASCVSSSRPSATSNSRSASVRSSPSTRLSLSELDPALRTRTLKRLVGPFPVEDLGGVLAVVARVLAAAQARVDHLLPNVRRPGSERRHAVDDVDDEVVAVEGVEHDHVERRRRGPIFLVAANVDVGVVGPPVGQA